VLVIAQNSTDDEAQEQALRALSHIGWIVAEVRRQGPITSDVSNEAGYLGHAVKEAMEHGFQIVVYDS
jgi:hypothetical protein